MKSIFFGGCLLLFISCSSQQADITVLQARIDSLEHKAKDVYTPGIGEFMINIQMHHAKLWYAGNNQNWVLADFEVEEIKEAVEDIKKFHGETKEAGLLDMINPALDSISRTISKNNKEGFRPAFNFLTGSCNNCHKNTDHPFNVIRIPEEGSFPNQDFKKPEGIASSK